MVSKYCIQASVFSHTLAEDVIAEVYLALLRFDIGRKIAASAFDALRFLVS